MKLKSMVLGFEIPFFKELDEETQSQLGFDINETFLTWFQVKFNQITYIPLQTGNILLLYQLVVTLDPDFSNEDLMTEQWEEMRDKICEIIGKVLENNNLEFRYWHE